MLEYLGSALPSLHLLTLNFQGLQGLKSWEGLLSEGYLRLKFGGLTFGRAYFFVGLLSEFYGI